MIYENFTLTKSNVSYKIVSCGKYLVDASSVEYDIYADIVLVIRIEQCPAAPNFTREIFNNLEIGSLRAHSHLAFAFTLKQVSSQVASQVTKHKWVQNPF